MLSYSARSFLAAALVAGLASASSAQTLTPPDSTAACRWMAECSAPGTSLRMEERSRVGDGRGARVTITPKVSGFPAGAPLTFWAKRVGQGAQWYVTGYVVDGNGAVSCADKTQHAALASSAGTGWCPVPLDSLSLTIGDAMQGEPFAFAMSTPDGRITAYDVIFPRPLRASSPGCGSLEASVVDPEAKAIAIVGRGFPAGAQVTTSSTSGKETIPGSVAADSTGRFVAIVTPGQRGGRGGDATFTARTAGCELSISYPWGRSAR